MESTRLGMGGAARTTPDTRCLCGAFGCHWCEQKTSSGTTTADINIWSDQATDGLPTVTDLKAKLEALPNIVAGSVDVTMQLVDGNTEDQVIFTIQFTGDDVVGNVPFQLCGVFRPRLQPCAANSLHRRLLHTFPVRTSALDAFSFRSTKGSGGNKG